MTAGLADRAAEALAWDGPATGAELARRLGLPTGRGWDLYEALCDLRVAGAVVVDLLGRWALSARGS